MGRPAVWLPAFYIDISPITCTVYSRFLVATDHCPPATWSTTAQGRLDYEPSAGNELVAGIGWDDALAYAAWAGKELPTVEQWLRAATDPKARSRRNCESGATIEAGPADAGRNALPVEDSDA